MADVVAIHMTKDAWHEAAVPGSFYLTEPDSDGELTFWYVCPCGCGVRGALTVGDGFKPSDSPSWQWNGMIVAPTLTPSINHRGHWHGFLTDGFWKRQ